MTPMTRKELYYAAIAGEYRTPPDPMTRIEVYLDDILKGNASTLEPMTRIESYLAKISGADVEIPDPMTRIELYLAKLCGEKVTVPNPMTREEWWLSYWITNTAELPDEYKRVKGFSCNNNAMWQITDFKLRGSDTVQISFSVTGACNVWGCYQGTAYSNNYDLYVATNAGAKYLRYGNGVYLSSFSGDNLGKRFDCVYTPTGSHGMPVDSEWEELEFETDRDFMVGSTSPTSTSAKLRGSFYGDIIVDGRLHLVPCERLSDNVLGYYDLIGKTFYEPSKGYDGAVSLGYEGDEE